MTVPRLILASSSPRRRTLLETIGVFPDRIATPDIDETPRKAERPPDYALRLAESKARGVARATAEVVLAGDTTVALGRRILDKAHDEADVARFLKLLSGRRHRVLSAVAAIDAAGTLRTRLSESQVRFKRLSDEDIAAYVAAGEGVGKAGGYAIQGRAAALISWLSGSHSGVVGLPLYETRVLLRASGIACG